MAINLTLIRHTRVHNPNKICYGHFDIELDKSFDTEKKLVREKIPNIEFNAIFSSPLSRCTKLAHFCFDTQIIKDSRLKELNFGIWEGKTWKSVEKDTIDFFNNYSFHSTCPNGESFFDLQIRVQSFIDDVKENYEDGANIVIFSHGGPIRAFMSIIQNIPPMQTFNYTVTYGEIIHLQITK